MPRTPDWKSEISEGLRREDWALRGPKSIVKVLPLDRDSTTLGGYITLGKYLLGKTPREIEVALGLPSGYLSSGARVCRLKRLPRRHEYEYELTAQFPGGLAFNPAHSDPRYAPGNRAIHQWRIKDGAEIPADQASILELHPAVPLPYDWLVR